MAAPTDDQENLSPDPIERALRAFMEVLNEPKADMSVLEAIRDAGKRQDRAMVAAVQELIQIFEELGASFRTEEEMAFLCAAVTSGLRTQVLEAHEQRETDDRAD